MSHFIGLVFEDNRYRSFEDMLERYNEQTEDYDYIEFADRTDEVMKTWKNLPEHDSPTYNDGTPKTHLCDKAHYPTMESLAEDWYGYQKNDEGKWGYMHNPNAKWDWYSEGGRWDGFIKTTSGENFDVAHFTEIDWSKMLKRDNLPFCFVDENGEWHERATMGWWVMTANEKEPLDWRDELADYISDLRDSGEGEHIYVYAIDFHI